MAARHNFFNEERQLGHPGQTHDAHGKHDRHQSPATTDAREAVAKSHPDGSFAPSMPVTGEEREWGATVIQTRMLQRGDLIETRHEEYRRGHEWSGTVPDQKVERRAANGIVKDIGDETVGEPRQSVAGNEAGHGLNARGGAGALFSDESRERADVCQFRREHHRRQHQNPANKEKR